MAPVREYSTDELLALLPIPAKDANKYTRGTLHAIVGSKQYPGAACLVAYASQRMGAGYTEVATDPYAMSIVQAYRPSLVVRSHRALKSTSFTSRQATKPHAYLVGSGFEPGNAHADKLVHTVLKQAKHPVLIDGGGLATLTSSKAQHLLKRRFTRELTSIITPHAGEAARLAQVFSLPTDNSAELACLLSLAYGVIAVVKGPQTFVSDGEEIVRIVNRTPALSKAGTGDVLAGMIGALLAQGIAGLDAAVLGAELHGYAGRLATIQVTEVSTTAEDVIENIPTAIKYLVNKC